MKQEEEKGSTFGGICKLGTIILIIATIIVMIKTCAINKDTEKIIEENVSRQIK